MEIKNVSPLVTLFFSGKFFDQISKAKRKRHGQPVVRIKSFRVASFFVHRVMDLHQ
jgi:hypothetical protein